MSSKLEAFSNIALVAAAVTVAAALGFREFGPPRAAPSGLRDARAPVLLADPTVADSVGIRVGAPHAKVSVVEFGDFQCPYCKRFGEGLRAVMAEFPDDVAFRYVHFPLDGHSQARPAAAAAECASAQSRFLSMHDELFRNQATLGAGQWEELAKAAEVPDLPQFKRCMEAPETSARVDADFSVGRALDVRGTPTVIINGWRFDQWPDEAALRKFVHEIVQGRGKFDPSKSFQPE